MITASVTINSEPWIIQCNALARALHQDVPAVLKNQAMLWTGQIMRFTPPTKGRAPQGGEKDKRPPQSVGAGAVFGDIRRAMTPADPEFSNAPQFIKDNPRIRKMVLDGDKAAFSAVLKSIPGFHDWRVEDFNPSTHTGAQNAKGRVRKAQKIFIIGTANFSRWWHYVQVKVSHVGRLKAGWFPALRALGGKTGQVPAWITRHAAGARGRVEINLAGDHPSILVANSAMGVGQLERFANDTFRKRVGVMKKQMEKLLAGYSKQVANRVAVQPLAKTLSEETFAGIFG